FFFQAEDGIRDRNVTGVQTCALPISFTLAIFWSVRSSTPVKLIPRVKCRYLERSCAWSNGAARSKTTKQRVELRIVFIFVSPTIRSRRAPALRHGDIRLPLTSQKRASYTLPGRGTLGICLWRHGKT